MKHHGSSLSYTRSDVGPKPYGNGNYCSFPYLSVHPEIPNRRLDRGPGVRARRGLCPGFDYVVLRLSFVRLGYR